jgi:hypothetical protein
MKASLQQAGGEERGQRSEEEVVVVNADNRGKKKTGALPGF